MKVHSTFSLATPLRKIRFAPSGNLVFALLADGSLHVFHFSEHDPLQSIFYLEAPKLPPKQAGYIQYSGTNIAFNERQGIYALCKGNQGIELRSLKNHQIELFLQPKESPAPCMSLLPFPILASFLPHAQFFQNKPIFLKSPQENG